MATSTLSETQSPIDHLAAQRSPNRTLINRKRLLAIIPLSDRTIYNMEKRGDFPRRIVLTSRNVAWDLGEVERWIDARTRSEARIPPPGRRPPSC